MGVTPLHHIAMTCSVGFAMLLICARADACPEISPIKLTDVKYADSIVIGSISNFRIVRDQKFRDRMLSAPGLSKEERNLYRDGSTLMSDYATFDLSVSKVLAGKVPARVRIKWRNASFGLPSRMNPGPFLVALAYPGSKKRTGLWDFESDAIAMLQGLCSNAFYFDVSSKEARVIIKLLGKR